MPYIPQRNRDDVDEALMDHGGHWTPRNAGELNYLTSMFINNYLRENGKNYANLNEMIGALECCKLELSRLVINPYEDEKIDENGPVYSILREKPNTGY